MRVGQTENGAFKTEVIADNSGQWAGNALRFDTIENARNYVRELALRWTLVRKTRVVRIADGVVVWGDPE